MTKRQKANWNGRPGQNALRSKFPDENAFREYMADLGRRGAKVTHRRYRIAPVGAGGYAYVDQSGRIVSVWGLNRPDTNTDE